MTFSDLMNMHIAQLNLSNLGRRIVSTSMVEMMILNADVQERSRGTTGTCANCSL